MVECDICVVAVIWMQTGEVCPFGKYRGCMLNFVDENKALAIVFRQAKAYFFSKSNGVSTENEFSGGLVLLRGFLKFGKIASISNQWKLMQ